MQKEKGFSEQILHILMIYQLVHIPSLKVTDIILMALLTDREMNQEAQKICRAPLALVTVNLVLVTVLPDNCFRELLDSMEQWTY